MSLKKTLASIVLAVPLVLGTGCSAYLRISGCYEHPQYECKNLVIGGDTVTFNQSRLFVMDDNILTVKSPKDTVTKEYIDSDGNDLKLESVRITTNTTKDSTTKTKTETCSIYDPLQKQVVEDAQRKFDYYLGEILKIKNNKMAQLKKYFR